MAIVGAGIAGLTAAHHLKKAGFDPFVLEAADHVGGRIRSERHGDAIFDLGAFIYLGSYTEAFELMQEVGLSDKVSRFKAYGAMPRNGELHYLDFDTPVRTILRSGYLSAGSKLKMLKLFALLFKHWKDLNYEDADGIAAIDNDTVTSYCERELNAEILEFVAAVVVRGPWLTSPQVASVGQLLWTLKNFFKPYFYGLEGGMDVLPRALSATQDVRLRHRVLNVTNRGPGVDITWADANGERTETVDRCLITTTTDRALEIFPQMGGIQRQFYESTRYITSVNTHLHLSLRPANPATYIMAAPSESPELCGVIVDHLKAACRVPDDQGMITVFCRHEWCVKNLEASDQQVLDQVLSFVEPYYGDLGATLVEARIGRWPRVVPIMPKGRFKAIAAYQKAIDPAARVQFAGDLAPIGGVNAALVSGRNAARRIVAHAARVPSGTTVTA